MRQFLTLPILVPIVLGIALLILQPKSRRVRSIYIMAASLATTALSLACIVLTYLYGSGFLACIMVRFNEAFSISLRIDGASMVYGAIDVYKRQVGDSLGIFCVLIGLMLLHGWSLSAAKTLLIFVFLWLTSPVCSHLVAEMEVSTVPDLEKECEVEVR